VTFAAALAGQLARPRGSVGRLLGHAMDFANRKPTRLAIDLLAPRAGERILDAGCGTGAALDAMLRRGATDVIGIDPSGVMTKMAAGRLKARAAVHRSSIESMSFEPASFDGALLLNVLYFCDADGSQLACVRDVLKPGGRAVAYVTHRDTMSNWAFARVGRHRLYDEGELMDIFVRAGFARETVSVQSHAITNSVIGLLAIATR
jgi:SAM-dependent methyltransferase